MIEYWVLKRMKNGMWRTCRYLHEVDIESDISWRIVTSGGDHAIVHVLCPNYTQYRDDIRDTIYAMSISDHRNVWVTYKRVTVDLRG